jgi:hypothetical protein
MERETVKKIIATASVMNTSRLTNVAIYNQYLTLCVQNIRSANNHLDDVAKDIWLWRFITVIHFMQTLGYSLHDDNSPNHYEAALNLRFVRSYGG